MKKITLMIKALAILALTSCGNSTSTIGTNSSTDWFEFDNQRYNSTSSTAIESAANPNQVSVGSVWNNTQNGVIDYASVAIIKYSNDSMVGGFNSSIYPVLPMSYKTKTTRSGFSNPNCAKTVNVVKNSNGSYTVTGQFYGYENYDSTKRHTIKLNFTTK